MIVSSMRPSPWTKSSTFVVLSSVVTCFFIDTAPVVMEYVETIFSALRPGGVWVNLGPLLYHWAAEVEQGADSRYAKSVELSFEEVRHVIASYGFIFKTQRQLECKYTCCASSMMHTVYNPMLFTAVKPDDAAAEAVGK